MRFLGEATWSHHDPASTGDDEWSLLILQGGVGLDVASARTLEIVPFVSVGVSRFDPDPGSGFLRTLTPFSAGFGSRASVRLGERFGIAGRLSLLAATGGDAPGPDGGLMLPLGLGVAVGL